MPSPKSVQLYAAKRGLDINAQVTPSPMRSQPIPQIPMASAVEYAWQAHIAGSDAAELHGDCTSPIDRVLRGVGSIALSRLAQLAAIDDWDYADGYGWVPGKEPEFRPPNTRSVTIRVRCRKCAECLAHKRRQWTARGIAEVRHSMRTWFGTLTVSPERRFQAKLMADKREGVRGNGSLSKLSSVERTRAIAAVPVHAAGGESAGNRLCVAHTPASISGWHPIAYALVSAIA